MEPILEACSSNPPCWLVWEHQFRPFNFRLLFCPKVLSQQLSGSHSCVCLTVTHHQHWTSIAAFKNHLVLQSRRLPLVPCRTPTARSATSRVHPETKSRMIPHAELGSNAPLGEIHCDSRSHPQSLLGGTACNAVKRLRPAFKVQAAETHCVFRKKKARTFDACWQAVCQDTKRGKTNVTKEAYIVGEIRNDDSLPVHRAATEHRN